MSIVTEYPSWYILLCLALGLGLAVVLYFKDRTNRHFPKWLRILLSIFRFGAVSLLAFFLLKPLIKTTDRIVEKPLVVFAMDNSESVVIGSDSTDIKSNFLPALKSISQQMGDNYEVVTYHFGEHLQPGLDSLNFDEKITDFSNLLEELYTKYSNRNLGAVVVASDGLYNKGMNPLYSFKKLDVPIYTVALGDTTAKRDVLIKEVINNRLAYLGNEFPMQITIESRQAQGEKLQVKVMKKGSIFFNKTVDVNSNFQDNTFDLTLDAKEVGLQRYTVTVSAIKNEVTYANNRKDVFIDILDNRQKILILANSPHPDIAAIKESIENNENYEVTTKLSKDFKGKIKDYSLVIFHQIPNVEGKSLGLVTEAMEGNIPSLFVTGIQMDFTKFNSLNLGFSFNQTNGTFNETNAMFNEGFTSFTLSDESKKMIRRYPPLFMPFGQFEFSPGVNSFIYQRIGSIETQKPLMAFNKINDDKIGLIAGEGLWRWKNFCYLENQSHDAFDELILKQVQFLAAKEDKSQFRVSSGNNFLENEPIIFNGEVYNESYELINDPDVSMQISDEEGNDYNFEFSRYNDRYRLEAGSLPVGNYYYVAKTRQGGKNLKETGEFSVSAIQLEQLNTQADHHLLYQFAEENGGKMVMPDQLESLKNLIANNNRVHATSYESKKLSDLINLPWILFLILGLLSLEWLLRKRFGSY